MQNIFSKYSVQYFHLFKHFNNISSASSKRLHSLIAMDKFYLLAGFILLGYIIIISALMYYSYEAYVNEQEQIRANLVAIVESLKDFHEAQEETHKLLKGLEIDIERLKLLNSSNSAYYYYLLIGGVITIGALLALYYFYQSMDPTQAAPVVDIAEKALSGSGSPVSNSSTVISNEMKDLLTGINENIKKYGEHLERQTSALELLKLKLAGDSNKVDQVLDLVTQNKTLCEQLALSLTDIKTNMATKDQYQKVLTEILDLATYSARIDASVANLEFNLNTTITASLEAVTIHTHGDCPDLSHCISNETPIKVDKN